MVLIILFGVFGTWFLMMMDVHGAISLDRVDDVVCDWFLEVVCGAVVGGVVRG